MKITKSFLKNYNLSIVLIFLFLISWIGQFGFQWIEFKNHSKEHNQEVQFSEYIPEFWSATLENWQSEFLQLFSMVVLTAFLIHKGSAESKDSTEEEMNLLKEIHKKLENLEEKNKKK